MSWVQFETAGVTDPPTIAANFTGPLVVEPCSCASHPASSATIARAGCPARAWIHDLVANGGELLARVEWLDEPPGAFRLVASIDHDGIDPRSGRRRGPTLTSATLVVETPANAASKINTPEGEEEKRMTTLKIEDMPGPNPTARAIEFIRASNPASREWSWDLLWQEGCKLARRERAKALGTPTTTTATSTPRRVAAVVRRPRRRGAVNVSQLDGRNPVERAISHVQASRPDAKDWDWFRLWTAGCEALRSGAVYDDGVGQ